MNRSNRSSRTTSSTGNVPVQIIDTHSLLIRVLATSLLRTIEGCADPFVLRRFKHQPMTAAECRRWAEALEGRDDLGYEAGYENTLKDFLFDIGTPGLVGGLTAALTARWENTLVTGTSPKRTTEPKPAR